MGSVALLLWGVQIVQSGTLRACGGRLRHFLGTALRNRPRAFFAGTAVTMALQSSTATSLMVTGFADAGLVGPVPALAVMLGANVGTALIVQAYTLPIAAAVPGCLILGYFLYRQVAGAMKDVGRVFMGLGLILLALHQLVEVVRPLEVSSWMHLLLKQLSNEAAVAILCGIFLAWAAHSSVAIVLLTMSFAAQSLIAPSTAIALVLGANLGTSLSPVFEAPSRKSSQARQLPIGNLLLRCVGASAVFVFIPAIARELTGVEANIARAVADFHLLFNAGLAVVFLPILGLVARWLDVLVPQRNLPADPRAPIYLDPLARNTPVVALGAAARETLRLTEALERMLAELHHAFDGGQQKHIKEAKRLDDILDELNTAIKSYIMALDPEALNESDYRQAAHILSFATHLEQAGDLIDKGLLPLAAKRIRRGVAFSPEGKADLLELIDRLAANVRGAASLFVNRDARAARLLVEEKVTFRDLVAEAEARHYARLRGGRVDTAETSDIHLDVLSILKQVNSHLVEGAAYPILESAGLLLASRLLPEPSSPNAWSPT